jgi:hypothetical protein
MPRHSISNYTTSISVEKTVAEISAMLAAAKASAILSEFSNGICTAISFRINTEFGLLTFRLPANIDAVYVILQRSRLTLFRGCVAGNKPLGLPGASSSGGSMLNWL